MSKTYIIDKYKQEKTISVTSEYTTETFTGTGLYYNITANYNRAQLYGQVVYGDLYAITIDPGETLCFTLTNTSKDGERLALVAQESPSRTPGSAFRQGDSLAVTLEEIDNSGFYTLTNSGTTAATYYVTVTDYKSSASTSGYYDQLYEYANALNATKYQLVTTRLTEETTAPTMTAAPTVTVNSSSAMITWTKATDNLYVAGYDYSVTDSEGNTVRSGKTNSFNYLTFNDLANGSYTISMNAFDLSGNKSDQVSSAFTIDKASNSFYLGIDGRLEADDSQWTVVGEFSAAEVTGNYYLANFAASTSENLIVAIYDTSRKNAKLVTTAYVINGKLYTGSVVKKYLTGSSYTVKVKGSSQVDVDYVFSVSCDAFPKPTDNNDFEHATEIALTEGDKNEISGWVGIGDAAGFYKFTVGESGLLSFDLDTIDAKTKFTLYDENHKKLKTVSAASAEELFRYAVLESGRGKTYYLSAVSGDNGKGKYNTPFDITVDYDIFPGDEGDSFDHPQGALKPAGDAVTGWVGYQDAGDYFSVTVSATEAGIYHFKLADATARSLKLTLYCDGKKITTLAANGTGAQFNLLAGEYTLAITSDDGGKGKYNSHYSITLLHDKSFGVMNEGSISVKAIDAKTTTSYILVTLEAGSYDFSDLKSDGITVKFYDDVKGSLKKLSTQKTTLKVGAAGTYYLTLTNTTKNKLSGSLNLADHEFTWTPVSETSSAADPAEDALAETVTALNEARLTNSAAEAIAASTTDLVNASAATRLQNAQLV